MTLLHAEENFRSYSAIDKTSTKANYTVDMSITGLLVQKFPAEKIGKFLIIYCNFHGNF